MCYVYKQFFIAFWKTECLILPLITCFPPYFSHFCPIWFPVENREEPIKSVLSVCQSVCVSVTDYLRNRSEDFSETRHEVGGKKCKNRNTGAFLLISHQFLHFALYYRFLMRSEHVIRLTPKVEFRLIRPLQRTQWSPICYVYVCD